MKVQTACSHASQHSRETGTMHHVEKPSKLLPTWASICLSPLKRRDRGIKRDAEQVDRSICATYTPSISLNIYSVEFGGRATPRPPRIRNTMEDMLVSNREPHVQLSHDGRRRWSSPRRRFAVPAPLALPVMEVDMTACRHIHSSMGFDPSHVVKHRAGIWTSVIQSD
ncbi:hypothetical protein BDV59DRAFT_169685 [Aspergillus ambiguus]|uniref:uncharacterized protein n=1 Tax=Aspergillus ambiguus TaxID=176160 RepID=UPI003CCDCCFB